uniref:Chloride channel protein n=1 Tax=Albugo laibachii Nc14 TaxID=890382 RepID=F0WKR5_9STRA|nr:Chloride Channel (ClC) Family putative [Albugo laibachii Nc14]|eukprot:CCA21872.1 Chloride Channel (ClC) Family putative [Albugo laibachii Nc14]
MPGSYDTWKVAKSPEHFERLLHGDRRVVEATVRQLCTSILRLCKNLPHSPIIWLYLILLGSLSALFGLLIDSWVGTMMKWRRHVVHWAGDDTLFGYIVWTAWIVGLPLIATSCGHYISVFSDGSGIPRMRAIFAGVYQNPYDVLGFRTLVAKSIGTILGSASGLSVGRAGPYAHVVACIGFMMSKMSLFQRQYFGPENYSYLRAAVACGTTASFGSPLGGVLYSIEVTARYYEIKNLWEGVISASFCILVFKIVTFLKHDVLFERTTFNGFDMDWDIIAFVLLGALAGLGAGIFCKLAQLLHWTQLVILRRLNLQNPSIQRRLLHILSISLTTALITYPVKIMRLSDRAIVNEVFRDQSLSLSQWTQFSDFPTVTLFAYICLKFVISILPCGSPLSIGVFGPLFTIGAAIGRLYGETLMKYWKPSQSPATYAVVGAACFASSATQTVSTSVIFFELTGQLSHMVPLMIASVVAYFVSGVIAPSIYDILAEWAGLHAVCYDFNEHIMNQKYAENNMISVTTVFTRETTYTEALQALSTFKSEEYFPIVNDLENHQLIGCIRRFDLEVAIARFHAIHNHKIPTSTHPSVSAKILKLVSATLDFDKRRTAIVDDISLLNMPQDCGKEDSISTQNSLQFGPPFAPYTYTSVPVESYPPQVGEDVNLNRVHKLAAIYMWTQVYVVKHGRLLGVINLESSLGKLKREEVPITFGLD